MEDPCGAWREQPERTVVLEIHTEIVWCLLENFAGKATTDRLFRREMNRMLNQSLWAATEVKVSAKHDLRYVSGRVFSACANLGALRNWLRGRRAEIPRPKQEHVSKRSSLREQLYSARSRDEVGHILRSAESCVVTAAEHSQLANTAEGWARYAFANAFSSALWLTTSQLGFDQLNDRCHAAHRFRAEAA